MSLIQLAERRWLPDAIIRHGMRRLIRERLAQEERLSAGDAESALNRFADRLRDSPVAIEIELANQQHYEVPADFFALVLGPRLKYSCGLWEDTNSSLDQSEDAMLRLTCQRAGIEDGMRVMDLGCGWGSLSLWIAEHFRNCSIVSLSNSMSQRRFIEHQCQLRGYTNVRVITEDIARFEIQERFDRAVSVEMFEHVRNYERLLSNIKSWLSPGGQLFVHIFCHRSLPYFFETDGDNNWMGRHFFSGGIMPAENLFTRFQRDLSVKQQWWINGLQYARTCEHWLARLDAHRPQAEQILEASAHRDSKRVLVQRWRMFFMACAELFKFEGGQAWGVGHYLFEDSQG